MSELPLNELFASGYQLNHNGYREWKRAQYLLKKSDELVKKNKILSQNVSDLQEQLQESYKRIKELMDASIVSM